MAILHFQRFGRFGINIDDWPEPNEDGTYPNSDDDNADTKKPDEIDEMVTDEDVDDTGEPDDDDFCEDFIGSLYERGNTHKTRRHSTERRLI